MTNDFTKEELRHILTTMNSSGTHDCELCSSIRKKLETRIAEMPEDEPEFFEMGEG